MSKLFDLEVWKDFFDEKWRIRILLWGWEVARFRIDMREEQTFSGWDIGPIITRLEKGQK